MTMLRIQVFYDTAVLWWGNVSRCVEEISLMKWHFVVTRAIPQTEIPALPDIWVTNTTCQNFVPKKKKKIASPYIIAKT
jgi:hypothetical protein